MVRKGCRFGWLAVSAAGPVVLVTSSLIFLSTASLRAAGAPSASEEASSPVMLTSEMCAGSCCAAANVLVSLFGLEDVGGH